MDDKTWDLVDGLEKTFKLEFVKPFGSYKMTFTGSPLLKTTTNQTASDGKKLFDYWSMEDDYIGGIHKELAELITSLGFEGEWYTTDTISFSKI